MKIPTWKLARSLLLTIIVASFCQAEPPRLTHQGFLDLEAEVSDSEASRGIWTMDQHHLTLISIYRIDHQFRAYTSIEYEHGPTVKDDGVKGEFYLANAYLEYRRSDALTLRAGTFVTPFGIYNEFHDATPSIVSTRLPNSIYGKHALSTTFKDLAFAKFSTGIQVLGNLFSGSWSWKYKIFVSNGRGVAPAEEDDNANKAIGGRLSISPPVSGLRLGYSFYVDRHGLNADARQRTIGLDLEFDYGPAHFESELMAYDLERIDTQLHPTGYFDRGLGAYIQTSYLILERLTPFVRVEFDRHNLASKDFSIERVIFGINYSITPKVYIKSEAHLHKPVTNGQEDFQMYVASVAVAF